MVPRRASMMVLGSMVAAAGGRGGGEGQGPGPRRAVRTWTRRLAAAAGAKGRESAKGPDRAAPRRRQGAAPLPPPAPRLRAAGRHGTCSLTAAPTAAAARPTASRPAKPKRRAAGARVGRPRRRPRTLRGGEGRGEEGRRGICRLVSPRVRARSPARHFGGRVVFGAARGAARGRSRPCGNAAGCGEVGLGCPPLREGKAGTGSALNSAAALGLSGVRGFIESPSFYHIRFPFFGATWMAGGGMGFL